VPDLAPPKPEPADAPAKQGYFRELAEGLRFVRSDRLLFWMVTIFALGSLLAEPLYAVVLPVYAREVFGSAVDLGIMFAALAGGSILGGLIYALIGHRLPRRVTMIVGFGGRALTFWVLVALPPLWVIALSIVVNAIMLEPVNPMEMTIMQERVPEHMRGRVFSTFAAIGMTTMPVGMIGYGLLLSGIGLESTLWVLASINLIVPLAILVMPAFRDMGPPVARHA
jgi:MFS family permease